MRWFWGILLIFIGLIYLALNLGIIKDFSLWDLFRYWPLVLIILGTSLFFKNSKNGWIPVLLVTLASFALVSVVEFTKFGKNYQQKSKRQYKIIKFSQDLSQADQAKITINTGAIHLTTNSTQKRKIKGELSSAYFSPSINSTIKNRKAIVAIKTTGSANTSPRGDNTMNLELPSNIPLDLTCNIGAAELDLDLKNIILSRLDIFSGATDIEIKLGNKILNNTIINISSGASDVSLDIPEEIGVKIANRSPLSSIKFKNYNRQSDGSYLSKNYNEASKKIEIKLSTGALSIEVK